MQFRNNLWSALFGAALALAASFVVALLFAYTFRIPIPLIGYYGPFGEFSAYDKPPIQVVKSISAAWMFYGLFGGFIILPVLGAIAGVTASRKYSGAKNRTVMMVLFSGAAGALPVVILSILDYITGAW